MPLCAPPIMRLLIDENVDVKIVGLLKKLGHGAIRTPPGTKNGSVIQLAVQERRVLLTRDSDFTDAKRYPPSRCFGIIHLDIHPPHFHTIAPLLKAFLSSVSDEKMVGRFFVVGVDGYNEFS